MKKIGGRRARLAPLVLGGSRMALAVIMPEMKLPPRKRNREMDEQERSLTMPGTIRTLHDNAG